MTSPQEWKDNVIATTLETLRSDERAPALRYTEPPFNAATGNVLSPANAWYVASTLAERGAQSPAVMTFKQAQGLGLGIQKDAKGIPIFVPDYSKVDKNNPEAQPSLRKTHVYSIEDVIGAPDVKRTYDERIAIQEKAPDYLYDLLDKKERAGEIEVKEGTSRAFINTKSEIPVVSMPDYDNFSSKHAQAATLARLLSHVEMKEQGVGDTLPTLTDNPEREKQAYRHMVAALAADMTNQQTGLLAKPEHMAHVSTVGFGPLEEAGHDVKALGNSIIRDARSVSRSLLDQMPELKADIGLRLQADKAKVVQAGQERAAEKTQGRQLESGLTPSEFERVTDIAKETLRTPIPVKTPDLCEKGRFMGKTENDKGEPLLVVGIGKGQIVALPEKDTQLNLKKPLEPGQRVSFERDPQTKTLTLDDRVKKLGQALVECER